MQSLSLRGSMELLDLTVFVCVLGLLPHLDKEFLDNALLGPKNDDLIKDHEKLDVSLVFPKTATNFIVDSPLDFRQPVQEHQISQGLELLAKVLKDEKIAKEIISTINAVEIPVFAPVDQSLKSAGGTERIQTINSDVPQYLHACPPACPPTCPPKLEERRWKLDLSTEALAQGEERRWDLVEHKGIVVPGKSLLLPLSRQDLIDWNLTKPQLLHPAYVGPSLEDVMNLLRCQGHSMRLDFFEEFISNWILAYARTGFVAVPLFRTAVKKQEPP